MRWVAVIVLGLLGLAELMVRLLVIMPLTVSFVGLVVLVNTRGELADGWLRVRLWELAELAAHG